jgi:hypothetical protein
VPQVVRADFVNKARVPRCLSDRPHDPDEVEVDVALAQRVRRSARAWAVVVSIWLVASRSRAGARVPGGASSTRARILSWTGAAVTQKTGTSMRNTSTRGTPCGACDCGCFPRQPSRGAPCPSPRRRLTECSDVKPVDLETVRLFLHVLAATIWVGGQITLAALVPALRSVGAEVPKVRPTRSTAWPGPPSLSWS